MSVLISLFYLQLGHSSLATTAIYLRARPQEAAYEAAGFDKLLSQDAVGQVEVQKSRDTKLHSPVLRVVERRLVGFVIYVYPDLRSVSPGW